MHKKMHFFHFTILFVFVALLFGCQQELAEPNVDPIVIEVPPIKITDPITPSQDSNPKNNDAQISSNTESKVEETEPVEEVENAEEPVIQEEVEEAPENEVVISPYNPNKPTLMGVSINQSKDIIKEKFGLPQGEYVMEDPRDPITVYEYSGFQIGFNNQLQIIFVDVHSSSVNPGLNGLRMGDTVDGAIKALGNPNTRSDYVLNYKSSEVNLKLDIDPNTDTISSIKLFGVN